jgi:hypothetical protein
MVADGLLTRQRYREVPPRVDYELTERARDLLPVVGALARWGYDWTWSAPREGEEINIGAIFRTSPGLLEPGRSVKGVAEFIVEGDRGGDRSYVMSAADGEATISEQPVDASDARVTGPIDAWVAALGPDGDDAGLTFTGDRALADAFVGGFVEAAAAARVAA